MAVTSFIPEIWNAQLLMDFREQTVAAGLVNREYEGNATAGNSVRINTATAVSINDYAVGDGSGARTTSPEAVTTAHQNLLIDQEKAFDFLIDDIDRAQAAGSMDAYTRSAAEGLAEDADKFILATSVTGAGTVVPTPASAIDTGAAAYDVVRDLRKALAKALVPNAQRVLLVNAEMEHLLLSADSKLTNADVSGSTEGLRSASLGRLLGFDVYVSENLPEVGVAQALAMYRPSVAYVSQVEKTEAMRAQNSFSDRLRGLHVYGGKVVRPEGIAVWTNFGA